MTNLFRTVSFVGIALGLGLCASAAMAQQTASGNNDTQNAYSIPITNSGNSSTDSHDNNSTNYSVPISNSGNTANSNNTDSHDNNSTNYNVPISNSGNTATDSHDNNSVNTNNSQNYTVPISVADSGNSSTDSHANSSVNNSGNTATTMSIGNVSLAVGYEDLTGSVSGQSFTAGNSGGNIYTGALSFAGNAQQGFAGINNASYNTGMGSLGQAVNTVAATSSVTFQ